MRGIASLFGIVMIAAIMGCLIYGCVAGRDIAPPQVEDLAVVRPNVRPEDNAYTYFNAMTNMLFWPTNNVLVTGYLRGDDTDPDEIRAVIASNRTAFAEIAKGLACQVCLAPELTGCDSLLPSVPEWLKAGRLLAAASLNARQAHEYERSADHCIAVLRFADLIHRDAESLINYLVGAAILRMGLEQARGLAIESDAPKDALTRLAEALAGLSPVHPGFSRAMKTEYRMVAKTMDDFADGKFGLENLIALEEETNDGFISFIGRRNYFFQPEKTKQRFATVYRGMVSNAPLSYADMDIAHLEEMFEFRGKPHRYLLKPNAVGKILEALLVPAVGGILKKRCHAECDVAATQLVIAIRRHELADGKLPVTCEEIVPELLATWPADPYDGKALRYSPEKAIVYAVGTDLVDNGGSMALPGEDSSLSDSQMRWKAEDMVFQLNR